MVWKPVDWIELDPERCEITDIHPHNETRYGLSIKHPVSGKSKIFNKSQRGNWVWISPKHRDCPGIKTGYIIKDSLVSNLGEYDPSSFKKAQARYKILYPNKDQNEAVRWLSNLLLNKAIENNRRYGGS